MRLSLFTTALFFLRIVSAASSADKSLTHTITLYAAPLSPASSPPAPYAQISYNPTTLIGTLTPSKKPLKPSDSQLAKLGLYDPSSKQWKSAVVTSLTNIKDGKGSVVLHLGPDGKEVGRVSFAVGGKEGVKVIKPQTAPKLVLNGPVKLDPQGKVPVPEVEKTFFQKYWWIFLTVAFIALTTGGGDEK